MNMQLDPRGRKLGSTVSLYLTDGTPSGIRVIQKDNWTGVGVDCSRSDLLSARGREEFARSGVYLLVGDFEEAGGLAAIYIGEADELRTRVSNHAVGKDFWTRLAIFTSTDGSINKAHSKYLEARLFEIATAAKRCRLQNKVPPGFPRLNDSDRDLAERFLAEMLVVLPAMGITAFELPGEAADAPEFELTGNLASARGRETSQGFKVLAGSQARAVEVPSLSGSARELRRALLGNGVLAEQEESLFFTQDYVFDSPSAAAKVLIGGSVNGRVAWRTAAGRTLKEVQDEGLAGEETSPSNA